MQAHQPFQSLDWPADLEAVVVLLIAAKARLKLSNARYVVSGVAHPAASNKLQTQVFEEVGLELDTTFGFYNTLSYHQAWSRDRLVRLSSRACPWKLNVDLMQINDNCRFMVVRATKTDVHVDADEIETFKWTPVAQVLHSPAVTCSLTLISLPF